MAITAAVISTALLIYGSINPNSSTISWAFLSQPTKKPGLYDRPGLGITV
jgi:hypothetical protein